MKYLPYVFAILDLLMARHRCEAAVGMFAHRSMLQRWSPLRRVESCLSVGLHFGTKAPCWTLHDITALFKNSRPILRAAFQPAGFWGYFLLQSMTQSELRASARIRHDLRVFVGLVVVTNCPTAATLEACWGSRARGFLLAARPWIKLQPTLRIMPWAIREIAP